MISLIATTSWQELAKRMTTFTLVEIREAKTGKAVQNSHPRLHKVRRIESVPMSNLKGLILVDGQGNSSLWRWPDPQKVIYAKQDFMEGPLVVHVLQQDGNVHIYHLLP